MNIGSYIASAVEGMRRWPWGTMDFGACAWRRMRMLAKLSKFPIAVFSALSASTGYVVFCHAANPGILTVFLGVLVLAMGACTLNEWQDREVDACMARTCSRPVASGDMSPGLAFAIAVLLLLAGFLLLWLLHRSAAAWIGLGAVVWYNGIYAYLKRAWAFAVVPGALIGALPPVIGWTAAGGRPLDPHILALAFFFFIWQVPHFWLLLFHHGEEYERAGLPALTRLFSTRQLASLTFIWMLTVSASSLLLPVFFLTASPWASMGLVFSGFWLAWQASKLIGQYLRTGAFSPAFRSINVYALLVMALLAGDALF
jgi:heme o synthase